MSSSIVEFSLVNTAMYIMLRISDGSFRNGEGGPVGSREGERIS